MKLRRGISETWGYLFLLTSLTFSLVSANTLHT